MLGFFAKQPDHPLADAQEARRIGAAIAAREPVDGVEEAAAWMESLSAADGFKPALRLERALQLDEAVVAQARRVVREFIAQGDGQRTQATRTWQVGHDYWTHLLACYEICLAPLAAGDKEAESGRAQLPLLLARMLHAGAALLKWNQLRYGPIGNDYWSMVGAWYLRAEAAELTRKTLTLYTGGSGTSIEAEYLKILLFNAASMDKLRPQQIELAERLIAHFLPHFRLVREVRPENVYWVDASRALPPTRLARLPEVTPSLRFFSGGEGLAAVEQLGARIRADDRVPGDVVLGGQYGAAAVLPVLDHLALCWAPRPPMRGHARHRVKSRLVVVHGLEVAHRYVAGRSTDPAGVELWLADDVSQGGMGAQAPIARQDWIGIGVLIAMQPEGGSNWLLGAIRRYARQAANLGLVGIETLSKTPRAVMADAGGLQTEAFVLDALEVGEYARLLLPPAAFEDKVPVFFALDGKQARVHPREKLANGPDYLIGRFFVQSYC